jgi:hypothetical protein
VIIRLAEQPAADGTTLVSFGTEGSPGWFSWAATDHELEDLEAVLALRKARVATCPAEHGEHACVWTPGHAILHQCRACPERWR